MSVPTEPFYTDTEAFVGRWVGQAEDPLGLGTEFEAGGIVGVFEDATPDAKVVALWAGQACIFLFIQLQRPSPSTMQTPSPIVLRMRLACWPTSARSRGRKSAASEKTALN